MRKLQKGSRALRIYIEKPLPPLPFFLAFGYKSGRQKKFVRRDFKADIIRTEPGSVKRVYDYVQMRKMRDKNPEQIRRRRRQKLADKTDKSGELQINMVKLDNRLKKIADMVYGETVADIGSDHAYLPIWLSSSKKIKKAYALDISENCVAKIKKNIKKHGIPENMITAAVSDGFSFFGNGSDFKKLSDVIIAGMGGETIAEIIKKAKNTYDMSCINFIFQPNSKIESLKKYLRENNFNMDCAIIESNKRFYTVINAKYIGEKR